ncbi:Cell division protein FtsN [Serratia symbiotica]|nr:Cell division protein FtsN [Serratia symbiotica]
MVKKDYINHKKYIKNNKKYSNKNKINILNFIKNNIFLILISLIFFICSFYYIIHYKIEKIPLSSIQNNNLSNNLPQKPKERWKYIKELEKQQINLYISYNIILNYTIHTKKLI